MGPPSRKYSTIGRTLLSCTISCIATGIQHDCNREGYEHGLPPHREATAAPDERDDDCDRHGTDDHCVTDVGLDEQARDEHEPREQPPTASRGEPSQQYEQDHVREGNTRIPRLQQHLGPGGAIGERDHGEGSGDEREPARPPRQDCDRDDCPALHDRAGDERSPRGSPGEQRDRRHQVRRERTGMVPSEPAVGTGERRVEAPDIADAQIDQREIADRQVVASCAGDHNREHRQHCEDRQRHRDRSLAGALHRSRLRRDDAPFRRR